MTITTYRGWLIEFDPKPIPTRQFDWIATGPNYEGWIEGEYWVGNSETASADSREALEAEIDRMIDGELMPRVSLRFAIGLALLVAGMIGAHAVWVASGMPVPFAAQITDMEKVKP